MSDKEPQEPNIGLQMINTFESAVEEVQIIGEKLPDEKAHQVKEQ